jgi:hypothetical protein
VAFQAFITEEPFQPPIIYEIGNLLIETTSSVPANSGS